ncbi:hypothetical protein V6N13_109713 [Hibiscus sabdariffa]
MAEAFKKRRKVKNQKKFQILRRSLRESNTKRFSRNPKDHVILDTHTHKSHMMYIFEDPSMHLEVKKHRCKNCKGNRKDKEATVPNHGNLKGLSVDFKLLEDKQ